VTLEVSRGGKQTTRYFYSGANKSNGIGDQLRLSVTTDSRGRACASAFAASELVPNGGPSWTPLGGACFDGALARQGLSAQWGDVLFVRTRHDSKPVAASALTGASSATGYAIHDLSY
ncbi:MAG: hypothetical protein HY075_04690, partial [Deltaproteobacteria bacterium]|nr:hypothetical protein [Deltaproteobacteria bacterium]